MDAINSSKKVRIAHLAGPTATIQNTPPLVTSNKARRKARASAARKRGREGGSRSTASPAASRGAGDGLCRAVHAHPLESDAAELYGSPDGYIDADGRLRKRSQQATTTSRSTRSSC